MEHLSFASGSNLGARIDDDVPILFRSIEKVRTSGGHLGIELERNLSQWLDVHPGSTVLSGESADTSQDGLG